MKNLAARTDAAVQIARDGGDVATAQLTAEAPPPAEGTPAAPAAPAVAAPTAGQQTPENIVESAGAPPQPTLGDELKATIDLKLAAQREKRKAAEDRKAAEAARAEAEKLKSEALTEKQKYDALRTGTFKDTLTALGRDPLETFKELQREAIEAGTPEAQIREMRAQFEKQIGEKLEPLAKTIEELKAENAKLKTDRKQQAVAAYEAQLVSHFEHEIKAPDFRELRIEYGDEGVFEYVDYFDQNPKELVAAAKEYNVPLTDPGKGFTMREILSVLKAAQVAHEDGKKSRAAELAPPPAPAAPSAPKKTPTVNGTAERRNAGQTIGEDLAGERASPAPRLSRKERIDQEIERLNAR